MTPCNYLAAYAVVSTLGCAVSARIIVGLKEVIHDKERALGLEDCESMRLRKELADLKANLLAEPSPHRCRFSSEFHPIHYGNETMTFCSEPGCWASRVMRLDGTPIEIGSAKKEGH